MKTVRDFYKTLDTIAPFTSACSWDNVGLLIGDMDSNVHKLLFTLDVTPTIVDYAIDNKVDLIIAHHPMILFQPLKHITDKKVLKLIENKIAVIAAHTNLDVAPQGVNFALAKKLLLQDITPLSMMEIPQYLIKVYIPPESVGKVVSAMHQCGAGVLGAYSHCANIADTMGQYLPTDTAKPYIGQPNLFQHVKEQKVEIMCEEMYLSAVVKAMINTHPYEVPAYYIIPLKQKSPNLGMGCKGALADKLTLGEFALYVRKQLNAPFVKLWLADGDEDTLVKNVAVCGGAGNSIIHEARSCADVYVSSDFTYHQILDAPLPVVDAGHFYTENIVWESLKDVFSDFEVEMMTVGDDVHDVGKLRIVAR